MKTIYSILVFLGALVLAANESMAAPESPDQPATLRDCPNPIYPVRATLEGEYRGDVELLLDLDNEGNVTDLLVLESTHPAFTDAVLEVVPDWKFNPAQRGGRDVPSVKSISFHFSQEGLVNMSVANSVTMAFLNSIRPELGPERFVARMSELDKLPAPVEMVRPMLFREIPPENRSGRAVFQFFIDRDGRVRMPVLTELEGDIRLAESAVIAIEQWRFEPPMVKGRPVIAHARQEFRFNGE